MTTVPNVAPPQAQRRRTLRGAARSAAWGATLVSAALGATGALGGTLWPLELACHFRAQYVWLAAIGLLAADIGRAKGAALAASLVLAWHIWAIAPFYFPATNTKSDGEPLRVMSLNVHARNSLHARAISAIRQAKPDVVFVLEVNDRWMGALAALADEYPYSYAEPRENNFGMAVFSRYPLASTQTLFVDDDRVPFLEIELDHAGRRWTLLGAHPVPPVRLGLWGLRNRQLELVAQRAAGRDPFVVVGDLNITSWSPAFQQLLTRGKLHDSRVGFGLQASWPAPIPLARIPIDHALVSPDVAVIDRSIGPEIGSDHLPIVVDVEAATTRTPPVESR